MRVRYTQAARHDLLAIQDYAARHDPRAAFDLATRIRRSVDELSSFPRLGRPLGRSRRRQLVVAGTPYVVVYRLTGSKIQILSIVHGRRKRPV